MLEIIRTTIARFCLDFIKNPYLCYTEHGQHALFYRMLYDALPEQQWYLIWQGQKVCVIQKEYPTAGALGKSKRQHWDIAILEAPVSSHAVETCSYDNLPLYAVIEFGLNESEKHLKDDIHRLCHKEASIQHAFIVHLYRCSDGRARFSGRDCAPESQLVKDAEYFHDCTTDGQVDIYYAMYDSTKTHASGAWLIKNGSSQPICEAEGG